ESRRARRFPKAISFAFAFGLRFGLHALRKLLASGLTIPLLEGLVGDLPLHEQLGEFPALRLALEWHFRSVGSDRHVQPAVSTRLREAVLLLNVMHVFVAELFHRRDDRADGGVAEGAERFAAD